MEAAEATIDLLSRLSGKTLFWHKHPEQTGAKCWPHVFVPCYRAGTVIKVLKDSVTVSTEKGPQIVTDAGWKCEYCGKETWREHKTSNIDQHLAKCKKWPEDKPLYISKRSRTVLLSKLNARGGQKLMFLP